MCRLTLSIRGLLTTVPLMLACTGLLSCGHQTLSEDDRCVHAQDGVCDDASYPISTTSACEEGSDFSDCNRPPICQESCIWSGDGDCDDGGANSVTSVCDLGSDCSDCGPR